MMTGIIAFADGMVCVCLRRGIGKIVNFDEEEDVWPLVRVNWGTATASA